MPDLWAFVLGLLVTDELAGGERRAEVALARAKARLAAGDWPATLAPAFRQASRKAFEAAVVPQIAAHVQHLMEDYFQSLPPEEIATAMANAMAECKAWWCDPEALADLGPVLAALPADARAARVTEALTKHARARLEAAIADRVPPPADLGLLQHGLVAFGETQTEGAAT